MLNDKVVLLTGGTGSFGREFTRIVLGRYRPRKLIVFSRDELKQYEMRQSFPEGKTSPIRYFIGDVRDRERLYRALDGADVVVHAAALKQVPACENNPFEAIQTNIIGAKNLIDAAVDRGVRKVLAISTDKAVNPISLYGASKLCAEKMFVQANAYSVENTLFSVCRYGNVVGSRGSVVPLFLEQRKNGRVTVTETRMTRFWLTITEGVEFAIRCIDEMLGGEIFVPKIPSMSIMDLAQALAPEAKVEYIGIRAGEKLHEILVSEDEARHAFERDGMYVIEPLHPWWVSHPPESARRLADGFSFASDRNERFLSIEELRRLAEAP